jgi:plastocyanin
MRAPTIGVALLLAAAPALRAQSVLERSPNIQGTWTLPAANAAFVFTHRFEFIKGGDELRNLPTLTLALGLPVGLTAGLDYTSNSEISVDAAGGNETEFWLKRAFPVGARSALSATAAYNNVAGSADGAVDARFRAGPLTLLGELRGYSDMFDSGDAGVAGGVGGIVQLTPYLGLAGDVGRVISADSFPSVWSAALAVAIPGTPHTFSLQASNVGATTLQGVSHRPRDPLRSVRYGFVFTLPLGTWSQWSRIFRPAPAPTTNALAATAITTTAADSSAGADRSVGDSIAARVQIRQVAFQQREVHIHAGQSVEWTNQDPTVHTVTGNDGSWGSDLLTEGKRYSHRFDRPGRYAYHCLPHPMMTAVVVVE